jgi:hypothetical protein
MSRTLLRVARNVATGIRSIPAGMERASAPRGEGGKRASPCHCGPSPPPARAPYPQRWAHRSGDPSDCRLWGCRPAAPAARGRCPTSSDPAERSGFRPGALPSRLWADHRFPRPHSCACADRLRARMGRRGDARVWSARARMLLHDTCCILSQSGLNPER